MGADSMMGRSFFLMCLLVSLVDGGIQSVATRKIDVGTTQQAPSQQAPSQLAPSQLSLLGLKSVTPLFDKAGKAMEQASLSFQQVPGVLATKQKESLQWLSRAIQQGKQRGKRTTDILTLEGSIPDKSPDGFSAETHMTTGSVAQAVTQVNMALSKQVVALMAKQDWQPVATKDGIEVQRRSASDIESGGFPPGIGPRMNAGKVAQFVCVRAIGEIDAPVENVYKLFLNNEYVCEYNDLCQEVRDVGFLDPSTKISWASSKRVGPFSPRDFVTRCHYRRLWDGSLLLSTMSERGLDCNSFRDQGISAGEYCRMDIILAGYLFQSIDSGKRTRFQMVSLCNPGGALDSTVGAMISNMLCSTGPIKFINAIRRISSSMSPAHS